MALLSLDGVSRCFWRGERRIDVLAGVSLDVDGGEFVAVYGARSAGKTTLLRLAAGLDRPDAGTITFAGRALADHSARELARLHREQIAWVDARGPSSDELSVADYVALPLLGGKRRIAARAAALDTLERVGLSGCADERWPRLSDAERSLVALAHAVVREPRLLVVDDPTGGLDLTDREHVLDVLRRLAHEARAGVLMAVPEIPSTLRADRILSLSGGRLVGAAPRTGTVVAFRSRQRLA